MSDDRSYKVMIDPGHGGEALGAVNKEFVITEKDINLSVANMLKKIVFSGDYLYETWSTRREDVSVSLKERCNKANYYKANAFLSIHCNARPRVGKKGLELEVFHAVGSEKGKEFATIALDYLAAETGKIIKVIRRRVMERNFYVLKHTSMPAILVELGFLPDPEEALFLNNKGSQRVMARSLAEATEHFLEG